MVELDLKRRTELKELERSIILACDVETIGEFGDLVNAVDAVEGIGGYKIGFTLGLRYGLENVVNAARKQTDKLLIYDHGKGGTDIPYLGKSFAKVCRRAGVDAVILLPQAGPTTEETWIREAFDSDLDVIVGGEMSHDKYKQSDGGFIADEALDRIYRIAARCGVRDFVVPGTKPDRALHYRKLLREFSPPTSVLFGVGIGMQGGTIEKFAEVAGEEWHVIIGRDIYKSTDPKLAAQSFASKLWIKKPKQVNL